MDTDRVVEHLEKIEDVDYIGAPAGIGVHQNGGFSYRDVDGSGSVHKRPKVAANNPGGLKGLLTHGNTRDAGMAIYPSLEDASYTHLTGPQKVAKRAQRRSSRGSVVSY